MKRRTRHFRNYSARLITNVARRIRLDAELVRRHLARSRTQAAEYISQGRVIVNGVAASKPATQVADSVSIVVREVEEGQAEYASRGGHKLAGALDLLGDAAPVLTDKRALDAGASTGGFTDVLLRRGVREVVAVDVGYGQLVWSLQQDPRVKIFDRTNVRTLTTEIIGAPVDIIVADLSFISLTLVLPAFNRVLSDDGEMLLMVKPQFEVGKERIGSGGVVRDIALHHETVKHVAQVGQELGLYPQHIAASPLPGPSGNVEYFIHSSRQPSTINLDEAVAAAIAAGPAGVIHG